MSSRLPRLSSCCNEEKNRSILFRGKSVNFLPFLIICTRRLGRRLGGWYFFKEHSLVFRLVFVTLQIYVGIKIYKLSTKWDPQLNNKCESIVKALNLQII